MNQSAKPVYIGIHGTVLALDRSTGNELWRTNLKGSDFVNVIEDRDVVFASTQGELFCLHPDSGEILWNNRLKGLGHGLITIATESKQSQASSSLEQIRREQQAASSAAASASASTASS